MPEPLDVAHNIEESKESNEVILTADEIKKILSIEDVYTSNTTINNMQDSFVCIENTSQFPLVTGEKEFIAKNLVVEGEAINV
jgi:hypothetical protein